MNENLLDVLFYLFENFSLPEPGHTAQIRADLDEAGFFPEEIDDAFAWLHGSRNDEQKLATTPSEYALRIYSQDEKQLLSVECRGYLGHLQHCGVLDGATRETVIDRLLALADGGDAVIDTDQLKWVVMMVLSSRDEDRAVARMEALLHAEQPGTSH